MYSKRNESDLSTPFCTLSSGMRYSFISPGSTVNGEHVSATMAMATVVHTRFWRSCTLRFCSRVASTSCGPMAFAMYPKVLTVARRIAFLCAFSMSSSSKQMRIHSRAETNSAPRSAMRPTRSMQFSCTTSCRFLRIGERRGSRSLMGGVIFAMPITLTIALSAPRIEPSTSGYSSPRYSYSTTPRWPMSCSSPHVRITTAMRDTRSAACCRTLADLLLSRHLIVPQICGRYGFVRPPSAFTMVPKPLSMTAVSSPVCSWKEKRMPSTSCSSSLWSMSAAERLEMTFSIVSMTILRYGSDSSLRSSTMRVTISEAPTLLASSSVVSTSWR
mmetsp:Transcript_43295/g.113772  ORF Transcript_43295/g.113772 Transcript_43295/m.113772 type:complete len:330 (-) Transcript_43295:1444-2433(-)